MNKNITIKITVTPQGGISLLVTPKASIELVLTALEEARKQILCSLIGIDEEEVAE